MATFTINGVVISSDGTPAPGLLVRAWDEDRSSQNDLLGEVITDAKGRFMIQFTESAFLDERGERAPSLNFQIGRGKALMSIDRQTLIEEAPLTFRAELFLGLSIDFKRGQPLKINSLSELISNERAVTQRINALPNGGNLFVIHPLKTLAEAGIVLSPQALREWSQQERQLLSLSETPYQALKSSESTQRIRYHLSERFNQR